MPKASIFIKINLYKNLVQYEIKYRLPNKSKKRASSLTKDWFVIFIYPSVSNLSKPKIYKHYNTLATNLGTMFRYCFANKYSYKSSWTKQPWVLVVTMTKKLAWEFFFLSKATMRAWNVKFCDLCTLNLSNPLIYYCPFQRVWNSKYSIIHAKTLQHYMTHKILSI